MACPGGVCYGDGGGGSSMDLLRGLGGGSGGGLGGLGSLLGGSGGGGGDWLSGLLSHVKAGVGFGNNVAATFNGPEHEMDGLIKKMLMQQMGGGASGGVAHPSMGTAPGIKNNPEPASDTRAPVYKAPIDIPGMAGPPGLGSVMHRGNPWWYSPTSQPAY